MGKLIDNTNHDPKLIQLLKGEILDKQYDYDMFHDMFHNVILDFQANAIAQHYFRKAKRYTGRYCNFVADVETAYDTGTISATIMITPNGYRLVDYDDAWKHNNGSILLINKSIINFIQIDDSMQPRPKP